MATGIVISAAKVVPVHIGDQVALLSEEGLYATADGSFLRSMGTARPFNSVDEAVDWATKCGFVIEKNDS